jgi:uncharacterized protein YlxW (UPF0749 family)
MDDNQQTPEPENTPEAESGDSKAVILLNMESMIKSHISALERLEEQMTKHRQMLDDVFNNDRTYQEHSQKAKEATKLKSGTKMQIMKQPQVADLANKVKSMKAEMAELQDALSDYLQQFQQMSGLNEIEGEDGEIRQIVYVARLVKKANIAH